MKIDASQIHKLIAGYVRANAFTASGASSDVTAALTTVLATAGDGGVQVPLQEATGILMGVVTAGGNNRVEIYRNDNKQKITKNGGEVYGRMTFANATYTLTYFYLNNGVETAYSFTGNTVIDFEFIYRFDFEMVPYDYAVGSKVRNVNEEGSNVGRIYTEKISVTGLNTVADLTFTPDQNYNIALFVNSKHESNVDSPIPFTVTGKSITWSAVNAGYNLKTDFSVIARYTTLQ